MCKWPELQSVRDIQAFLRFANFYQQFIQGFNRLAALLTSILKITSIIGLVISTEVKNEKQDNKKIQIEN